MTSLEDKSDYKHNPKTYDNNICMQPIYIMLIPNLKIKQGNLSLYFKLRGDSFKTQKIPYSASHKVKFFFSELQQTSIQLL